MSAKAIYSLAIVLLGLCLTSVMTATTSFQGGADTGGTDRRSPHSDSAWFLGKDEIKYCMVVSDDFGFDAAQLPNLIDTVAKTWDAYFKRRGGGGGIRGPLPPIDSTVVALDQCNGTEDVKFYFGVEDQQVQNVKRTYENPVAFAHRTEYKATADNNSFQGWGKGFIWVASSESKTLKTGEIIDWSKPCALHGMLLHEWGHVMGTGHVPGTVMDENIFHRGHGPANCARLTRIDQNRELLRTGQYHYKGMLLDYNNQFYWLTGKKAAGIPTLELYSIRNTNGYRHHFRVKDDVSEHIFPITEFISSGGDFPAIGQAVFKTSFVFSSAPTVPESVSLANSSGTIVGTFKSKRGVTTPITVTFNGSHYRARLDGLLAGGQRMIHIGTLSQDAGTL